MLFALEIFVSAPNLTKFNYYAVVRVGWYWDGMT